MYASSAKRTQAHFQAYMIRLTMTYKYDGLKSRVKIPHPWVAEYPTWVLEMNRRIKVTYSSTLLALTGSWVEW